MDDLPELPFEKMLSYLSLSDLIKSRAVSWRWCKMIDSFKVKSLCYSQRSRDRIFGKSRFVGGSFASSFIRSSGFERFFNAFGQSIFSNLKKLRLCELNLNISREAFAETLQSFGQLEDLDLILFGFLCDKKMKFELNLPMLNSIHLEELRGIEQLTLDAPRLQKVKLEACLRLDLVHGDSVEKLAAENFKWTEVMKLKNLKHLYTGGLRVVDSTLLSSLEQLKEIHLGDRHSVGGIFEQKQRYGRADLKIFLWGCLLDGPDDPAKIYPNDWPWGVSIAHLVENPFRLADEIPFYWCLYYANIERVAPGLEMNVVNRLIDLFTIYVNEPVQDVQRFLDFLKNLDHIAQLEFWCCQPQELFDSLPDHCAVQDLLFDDRVCDYEFLFQLKHLTSLTINYSIDTELIAKSFHFFLLSNSLPSVLAYELQL